MSRIARRGWRASAAPAMRGSLRRGEIEEGAMDIAGHAALVSGGGSGLGRATARALAEAGARVAILDINEAAATEAAEEVGGVGLACDVTSAEATERAVAAARDK